MKFPKFIATVFLSCIGLAVALPAQAALTIDSATWDGRKLIVEGTDGRGGVVDVFYSAFDANGNLVLGDPLGMATVKGNGNWKLQINSNRNNPLAVPCVVNATLAGDPDILNFPVLGADPGTCVPQPPVNNPPVCTIDTPAGDVTITTGGSVDYTGTVVDPDVGDTVTIAWVFNGGTPANSSAEDPGLVTYSTAGVYTTTLDATDNNGASCVQQTRTIIVQDQPVNNPPVCTIDTPAGDVTIATGGSVNYTGTVTDPDVGDTVTIAWAFAGGTPANSSVEDPGDVTYSTAGVFTTTLDATDNNGASCVQQSRTITVQDQPVNNAPTARGDTYATPVGKTLDVVASRLSGVLYNDFDADGDAITIVGNTTTANGTLTFNAADGSFSYTPNATLGDNDNDSFTYTISDGTDTAIGTVNIAILSDQPDYKIMMNYELGMHCTGFEFSYCCVLPPYNSILAQVVKPESNGGDFPRLLEGDPNVGLDALGRETVVRDFDENNNTISKYQLRYSHDAQPRREGQGKPQVGDTLISAAEGNSLQYFASIYDSAAVDPVTGALVTAPCDPVTGLPIPGSDYNGACGVTLGDGDLLDPTDNFANGWLNHFYIYGNLEGHIPTDPATGLPTTLEADKTRLGVTGHVEYPADSGAALQPLGPTGTVPAGFENVLTFSADTGTVVYTQMKVLENLPIMLTAPRIWEALGLPLTPFEDTIGFFAAPGSVDEDSMRPYVAMKAQLHEYPSGNAVTGSNGHPVIGFGTAPIDIPNCERCHSVPALDDQGNPNVNSPNYVRRPGGPDPFVWPFGSEDLQALTDLEYNYWMAFYSLTPVDSDWYPRLKSAAINMLSLHDSDNGTSFTEFYPCDPLVTPDACPSALPPANDFVQNTRMGHESVICQKCHADNVIAVVKSGTGPNGLVPPITEAVHNTHRNTTEFDADGNPGPIVFNDTFGRDGGCQGCHPAHRSDGVMDGYPITLGGDNEQADSDNRLAAGGCFVGRDVHSNPMKDVDGAGTPEYLNGVGQWLADNVVDEAGTTDWRGIWCTNCHSQLGQELWKAENVESLVHAQPGDPGHVREPIANATLADVAAAIGISEAQAISWLDPKTTNAVDDTHTIWKGDPGLCNYVAGYFGVIPVDPAHDGNVATVEVNVTSAANCSTGGGTGLIDCGVEFPGAPAFHICGSADADGDFSVSLLDFCTTPDCVTAAGAGLPAGSVAVPVPMSAATDGRDHWLSPGEPHCADCHTAPFVEQSGNLNPFPPFNYPRKASLMRYSRGHQDISCQGCHESIHGLYPVTPAIDTTSYAQAAALNPDGSHGPLTCGACHDVNTTGQLAGVPSWINPGNLGITDLDSAIAWAHTYTDEQTVLDTTCLNCHQDRSGDATPDNGGFLDHTISGQNKHIPNGMMEKAQRERNGGALFGFNADGSANNQQRAEVCSACHDPEFPGAGNTMGCDGTWRAHLTEARVTEALYTDMSTVEADGSRCGW